MKKLRLLALAFVCSVAAGFTSCSDDDEVVYKIFPDEDFDTTENLDLLGKVKSVETISSHAVWNEEKKEGEKGGVYDKEIIYFTSEGIKSGYTDFDIIHPTENFRFSEGHKWERDSKSRITNYLSEYHSYQNLSSETPNKKEFRKTEVKYDDSKRKATIEYYHSENGTDYVLTDKRVHDYNNYGYIDWENGETISVDKKLVNRSIEETVKEDNLISKLERVIVKKDNQGNWTESYLKNQYFDKEGNVTTVYVDAYRTRTISYY